MIDTTSAVLALRTRARSLSVCTTGSTTLSASTTGYGRTTGSFLTDGFAVGMEVVASGFSTSANNGQGVITAIATLTMTVTPYTVTGGVSGFTVASRTLATEGAAAGRTVLATLPAMRAWENTALDPVANVPYLTEEFVPATNSLITLPASTGQIEETGLYVLTWYGLPNYGVTAIHKSVDALKALFSPGTTFTAGSDVVRVRTDTAVRKSQLIPQGNGWTACVLTIPWRTRTTNAIAA